MNLSGLMVITPPVVENRAEFYGMIHAALKGGADIIQLRLKPISPLKLMMFGRALLELTGEYNVPLIVDDVPLVAKEIGAAGVHVGKDDPDVKEIREQYGRKLIVGASGYCDVELVRQLEAQGADYVGFSSPYASVTKPSKSKCPLLDLNRAVKSVSIPVFAIGGITLDNVKSVLETGVAGVAVGAGIFYSGKDVEDTTRKFKELILNR